MRRISFIIVSLGLCAIAFLILKSGGGVRAIAMDPVNSDTVYAGTEGGGFVKSTDGDASSAAVNSGLTAIPDPVAPTSEEVPEAVQRQVGEDYGKLPLYFIENQGQLDPRVAYYIQGGDKSIYFTGRGVTFALTGALTGDGDGKPASEARVQPASYRGTGVASELGPQREAQSWERQRWVVKLDFVDANPNTQPVGQEPTDAVISYFKGING